MSPCPWRASNTGASCHIPLWRASSHPFDLPLLHAAGARQQTSENLETHEVTGLGGRFSLDLLRALVCHQTHKLTTYSFGQAVEAVLAEETELILPAVLAKATTARAARHLAAQARLVHRLGRKLKSLEETIEMARITGLPLRTIANQAQ